MSVGSPDLLLEAEASAEQGLSAAGEIAARSPLRIFFDRIGRDRVALAAAVLIVLLVALALLAPLIVKLVGSPGPYAADGGAHDQFGDPTGPRTSGLWPFIVLPAGGLLAVLARGIPGPAALRRWGWVAVLAITVIAAVVLAIAFWPSDPHLFGVDKEYRDVFARVLYGARVSLEVALVATGLSMVIGVALGMIAGFYRGWIDTAIGRLIDVLLAFPILLLAIGLAAACKLGKGCLGGLIQPGLTVVIAVIAFVNWTYIARIVRGQVLSLREKEFVDAARSIGASNGRILAREILPNLVAPIIVYSSLIIPQNVLFESALSFLGVGVQFPQASWGAMLSDASTIFDTAWWYMVFPGLFLLTTVLAFNLLGDGLQDALNPRSGRA